MQYIFVEPVDEFRQIAWYRYMHIAFYIVEFYIVDLHCLICILYIGELHLYIMQNSTI